MNIEQRHDMIEAPGVDNGERGEDKRAYCVYMHRNKINGKIYIGMTNDIERRWRYGGCEYRRSHNGRASVDSNSHPPFWNAIEKYGWDSFEHIVIQDRLTFDEAEEMETHWIAHYKSNCVKYKNPSYGYNLTDGGKGSKGRKMSEIEKQNLSAKNSGKGNPRYGVRLSEETKQKISAANKGRYVGSKNHRFGVSISEETRQKLRENHADISGANNPSAKPVMCIETGQVFGTLKEASVVAGVTSDTLSKIAREGRATKQGYHWEFVVKNIN